MADSELVKNAGEIVTAAVQASPEGTGMALAAAVGGFVLKEGGKIALEAVIRPALEDLLGRVKKEKDAGNIPEDFESTEHGATLLQEALNALLNGIDNDRAEAVKSVFLGLAMNPVEDSLEKVQQIEVMRIASSLTTWEVVLLNALERYKKDVFDDGLALDWQRTEGMPGSRKFGDEIRAKARDGLNEFDPWLKRKYCKNDSAVLSYLREALKSLYSKHVLTHGLENSLSFSEPCVYLEQGPFSDFGWKLAVHLYSATEK